MCLGYTGGLVLDRRRPECEHLNVTSQSHLFEANLKSLLFLLGSGVLRNCSCAPSYGENTTLCII